MAEQITLENLGGGAAIEKFQIELDRVCENLMDPNATGAMREIDLKVKFKPVKDSGAVDIEVHCTSKLAPDMPFPARAFVGKGSHGMAEIYESNPNQMGLFEKPRAAENVVDMKKEAGSHD